MNSFPDHREDWTRLGGLVGRRDHEIERLAKEGRCPEIARSRSTFTIGLLESDQEIFPRATRHGPAVAGWRQPARLTRITGMACSACANTVERAAKKIPGVTSAKAHQPSGSAEIRFDPAKTSAEAIAKAITAKTPFKAEVNNAK
jgi:copper chaperone CopZ